MLKPWMKALIWLGLGGGIGFFAGHQVGSKATEKRLGEADDVIWDNAYGAGYSACKKEYEADAVHEAAKAIAEYRNEDPDEADIPPIPTEEDLDIPDVLKEDPEEEDNSETVIPDLHPEDMLPHPITEDEFNRNLKNYDLTSLKYYAEEDVVYDPEYDDAMANPEQLLGIGWFALFGPDTRVIYIENDSMETLYRVEYDPGSIEDDG